MSPWPSRPVRRLALLAAAAVTLAAATGPVGRTLLGVCEKSIDSRLAKVVPQYLLLAPANGLYLPNYGVAFTATVNLAEGPGENPFRPSLTAAEKAELRSRKLAKLPVLRDAMRECLINSAASLDTLPLNDMVVFGVSLAHYTWEDRTNLPSQIVMMAPRRTLIGLQTNPPKDKSSLASFIQTVEY